MNKQTAVMTSETRNGKIFRTFAQTSDNSETINKRMADIEVRLLNTGWRQVGVEYPTSENFCTETHIFTHETSHEAIIVKIICNL